MPEPDDEHVLTRLAHLEDRLDELTELLGLVAGQIQPPPKRNPTCWSWLTVTDPEVAAQELRELTQWLTDVYLTYPDAMLPSCWMWHPALVEELRWLWRTHQQAHNSGDWWAIGEWHDRYRPLVAQRLRAAYGSCELREHTPTGSRYTTRRYAPLTEHTNLIATTWAHHRHLPTPTAQQQLEAELADAHNDSNTSYSTTE
jgi:hypothetical protein